jgi:uncharacterized protein (DUF1778 family)
MPRTKKISTAGHSARRDAHLNIRLHAEPRNLIDAAAAAEGKTVSEFVIDSARRSAIDALLDRRFFRLDRQAFTALSARLDRPPPPNAKLKQLFASRAPWDN